MKHDDRTPKAAPRKRFRIQKLEERVAPKGHYNPHSKWVGGGGSGGTDSSASGSSYSDGGSLSY